MSVTDIQEHIRKKTDAEISAIEKEMQEKIKAMQSRYDEDAKADEDGIAARIKDKKKAMQEKARVLGNMESRNKILSKKREMVDDALDAAIDKLAKSADYVDIVAKMMKNAAKQLKDGEVVPAKGKEDKTKEAMKKAGVDMKMSNEVSEISGGFLVVSEKEELDFSFESLIKKQYKERLETVAINALF